MKLKQRNRNEFKPKAKKTNSSSSEKGEKKHENYSNWTIFTTLLNQHVIRGMFYRYTASKKWPCTIINSHTKIQSRDMQIAPQNWRDWVLSMRVFPLPLFTISSWNRQCFSLSLSLSLHLTVILVNCFIYSAFFLQTNSLANDGGDDDDVEKKSIWIQKRPIKISIELQQKCQSINFALRKYQKQQRQQRDTRHL